MSYDANKFGTDRRTDGRTKRLFYARPKFFEEHKKHQNYYISRFHQRSIVISARILDVLGVEKNTSQPYY